MGKGRPFILAVFSTAFLLSAGVSVAIEPQQASVFVGRDLLLSGGEVISYQPSTGEYALVFEDGFSMSIGANQLSSDKAVVWLKAKTTEFGGRVRIDYDAMVYLQGNVSVERAQAAKAVDMGQSVVEQDQKMVVWFEVTGEVFVTADKRRIADPRGLGLYEEALALFGSVSMAPKFVVKPQAMIPQPRPEKERPKRPPKEGITVKPVRPAKPARPTEVPAEAEVKFRYPVNISPAGEVPLKIERTAAPAGTDIATATVIGRVYVWGQQLDEESGKMLLLELQADNAVIFYSEQSMEVSDRSRRGGGAEDFLGSEAVKAIYLAGDVLMTEGPRTVRADELYYDFERTKAIAINAEMRSFDAKRGIPIYVRAAKWRQVAENKFALEDITLTSSEFYQPQISTTASRVSITDTTPIDQLRNKVSDSSYDAEMHDVRLKVGKTTVFYWPFMRSNMQRPDVPLKSIHVAHDNIFGTSVESRWHLSRLLGLREPEGVDNTLAVDYFSKRGIGVGIGSDYESEDYYGRLLGYVVTDTGKDKLGRDSWRRNLDPGNELRGRFSWRHRHFLPYGWQFTAAFDYLSDENFLEAFYRNEFNVGLSRESYIHLKNIKDNRAISILGKARINDFADELEEIPTVEYHLTGESLFDDKFTLYSDSQISRLRQRIGDEHTTPIDEHIFSFASQRVELDMPVLLSVDEFPFSIFNRQSQAKKRGLIKLVPFVAGTFGYDDRSGFRTTLVDGSKTGRFGDDQVWLGEVGLRAVTQYQKVYPNVKSRLWDLNQLRHIIKPELTVVGYTESDGVVKQRDTLNIGVSQRLQTKRGPAGQQRTVDWMRLDMDVTFVDNPDEVRSSTGPDRFIWSRPIVPLRVFSAPDIFNGDLRSGGIFHRYEVFGPRRDYFGADFAWQLSDTSALLSDMNFDIRSSVLQQFNIGFSRLCWPNLSYYIGSRYLRRIEILDEKGSNSFTFAATYVIDPRYTLVFAQQFDFDYGANIRSDITLIRRYHRVYCGFTYSADESLDRQAIVFGIWPQGIPELAIGQRRYAGLGGSTSY